MILRKLAALRRCFLQLEVNNAIRLFSFSAKSVPRVMSNITNLKFDNSALRILPLDPETENYVRQVSGACFSRVFPTPVEAPSVVCYSESALGLIDLTADDATSEEYAEYFSGNKILPGSETAAHCYCGHQFGIFAGQLGDGAAV